MDITGNTITLSSDERTKIFNHLKGTNLTKDQFKKNAEYEGIVEEFCLTHPAGDIDGIIKGTFHKPASVPDTTPKPTPTISNNEIENNDTRTINEILIDELKADALKDWEGSKSLRAEFQGNFEIYYQYLKSTLIDKNARIIKSKVIRGRVNG